MDDRLKQAGSAMDALVASFNTRISEIQELVVARNMYPATTIPDLSGVDAALTTMEAQVRAIKQRLQEERNAIPKAKRMIEMSQRQQRKLQHMLVHMPSRVHDNVLLDHHEAPFSLKDKHGGEFSCETSGLEEPISLATEKRSRNAAPRWYVTAAELDSLSSYMRGRLTLEKVNIAINEIAISAEANSYLITAPRKKLAEDTLEKALDLRNIAAAEGVKGMPFILETDIRGPGLKLDNTGKAILTVLRHLGRVQETRIGHQRVITLMKPHRPL